MFDGGPLDSSGSCCDNCAVAVAVGLPLFCSNKHGAGQPGLL